MALKTIFAAMFIMFLSVNLTANEEATPNEASDKCEQTYSECLDKCDASEDANKESCYEKCDTTYSSCLDKIQSDN